MRGKKVGLTVEHDVEPAVAAHPGEEALHDPANAARQELAVPRSAGRGRDVDVVHAGRRGKGIAREPAVAEQITLEAERSQSWQYREGARTVVDIGRPPFEMSNEPCLSQMANSLTPLTSLPPSMPRVQAVGAERRERLSATTAEGRISSPQARRQSKARR